LSLPVMAAVPYLEFLSTWIMIINYRSYTVSTGFCWDLLIIHRAAS
jgi:hypothetical protein